MFCWRRLCVRYRRDLVGLAETTERLRGRRGAVAALERVTAGWGVPALDWQRDREAACAYHWLREPERAARHLRRSLIEHLCGSGSCEVAPGALVYLYLEAGCGLEAVLTARLFGGHCAFVRDALPIDLISDVRLRGLIDELVLEHRSSPADTRRISELVLGVTSGDADVRREALGELRKQGPTVSAVLFSAMRSLDPHGRSRIHGLLIDWALDRAARRFWPPDEFGRWPSDFAAPPAKGR
jgi:hypothetical protein